MKKLIFAGSFILLVCYYAQSQTSAILNGYITEGLSNNLALKQKTFALDKSYYALKEAKGLFMPSVYVQSDYTFADGGRKINLPVGDLLNPVYRTLNQLTGSSAFPQIKNVNEQFLPNDFHDTRLRSTLPLINAEIWYNNKIKKEGINQQQAEVNVYKRELVKEIKTAYFNYLRAIKAIEIYKSAQKLLQENLSITETLVKNNMVLRSNVLKVTSDINKNESLLQEAENNKTAAVAYFNFLLNKNFETNIAVDSVLLNANNASVNVRKENKTANREELQQLQSGINQTQYFLSMKKSYLLPTVGAFFDAGYQGFYYKFDADQRYFLGGVQLKWNLFNGFQNTHKTKQASIDLASLKVKLDETEKQINLQNTTAFLALNSAQAKAKSSEINLAYSQEFYRQTKARYASGQALVIELSDAFFQLINNQLQYQLAIAEVLIKQAEAERASANYSF